MGNPPTCLRILQSGLGVSFRDAGRVGYGRFGVPESGWMDPVAAQAANQLAGNTLDAVVLELLLQGQVFEALAAGRWAVTGGVSIQGQKPWSAFEVQPGDVLRVVPAAGGVWGYLAIFGGWEAPRFLGSGSSLASAGIGRMLRAGDEVGAASATVLERSIARRFLPDFPDYASPPALGVWPGPQRFPAEVVERFFATAWQVSARSDRSGYRLDGGPLPEAAAIISEPVLPGSIQVPPAGNLLVLMPDGPTVGGYPKIGVIDPPDLRWLAQSRPGQTVHFQPARGSVWE